MWQMKNISYKILSYLKLLKKRFTCFLSLKRSTPFYKSTNIIPNSYKQKALNPI